MVILIISTLASIIMPKVSRLTAKAYQAKGKGNLGSLRSAISIYYSDNAGIYPLQEYGEGDTHFTANQLSLSRILKPRYMNQIPIPKLVDGSNVHNVSCGSFDTQAESFLKLNPPNDVRIIWGGAGPAPGICVPFGLDNRNGVLYYLNDNFDLAGNHIYEW